MAVTVYSKPSCVQCDATYRALDKKGIEYTVVDLMQDEEAMALVQSLGHMQAPIVVAGDESWSGYRPDAIARLAQNVEASVAA